VQALKLVTPNPQQFQKWKSGKKYSLPPWLVAKLLVETLEIRDLFSYKLYLMLHCYFINEGAWNISCNARSCSDKEECCMSTNNTYKCLDSCSQEDEETGKIISE